MSIDVDDSSSAIIYSGGWTAQTNTISKQFGGTVHQTNQKGASATIRFTGTRVVVYQTVPKGEGEQSVDIAFDGEDSTISRHLHGDIAFYQDAWFDSGDVPNGLHTLVLFNAKGSGADESPFILDKIRVDGSPVFPATLTTRSTINTSSKTAAALVKSTAMTSLTSTFPVSATPFPSESSTTSLTTISKGTSGTVLASANLTSSSQMPPSTTRESQGRSATTETVTSVQYLTTSISYPLDATGASDNSSINLSKGVIIGSVMAGLAFLFSLCLLFFCLRRSRATTRRSVEEGKVHRVNDKPGAQGTFVTPYDLGSSANLVDYGDSSEDRAQSSLSRQGSDASTDNHTFTTPQAGPIPPKEDTLPVMEGPLPRAMFSPSFLDHDPSEPPSAAFRPHYMSGDTVDVNRGSDMLHAPAYFGRIDTNDVPPSYRSAHNRDSNL